MQGMWSGRRGAWALGALSVAVVLATGLPQARAAGEKEATFTTGSSNEIIEFINEKIRQGWEDNEVTPSPVAEDSEWLRRVYLDIVGHIPPAEDVEAFLADKDKAKRAKVIERLLEDPAYVRNWTTIWTNLSIGRQPPEEVSRVGMKRFFREAFHKNRPWNEVVYDLVSGEGHFEKNGAVNYLLAQMQMPDEGVQATAKTTRLFMGVQVQCTQCHNHPFNDWKQDQFWQFNAFFRQMRKVEKEEYNTRTGRMDFAYAELVNGNFDGPVFYENRKGMVFPAFPIYFDQKVDLSQGDVNRREELAKLMTQGDKPLIAQAMVNRMWGHFLGYGFTKPVDDMGPHNPPSHPELLDHLTAKFVESGYDVKQLVRWIANSEAYNLTSQFNKGNQVDNPAAGETPLFSHMYIKGMEAEQLYDSLIVATNAHKSGRSNWNDAEEQREQWMQQFVIAFGTDEGDEATTFNGTIPQALMMMNGELVRNAISAKQGSFLYEVLADPRKNDNQKVQTLYLSALSRNPTRSEMSRATQLLRGYPDRTMAYQDLFWALLNSNEFIFVH